MVEVVVLVPVLARPERVEPLLESLDRSRREVGVRPLILASPGDDAELAVLRASDADFAVVSWQPGPGDYARKINLGARIAAADGADFVFLGADDLCFCVGWADEAVRVAERTGKAVVGTDDLGNPTVRAGRHATHSLVAVDYLERGTVDEPGKLLHEGYTHQFCDTEFVGTAVFRDEWVFARRAQVEHLHPLWGKAADDRTYRAGQEGTREDVRLFQRRAPLWGGRVPDGRVEG